VNLIQGVLLCARHAARSCLRGKRLMALVALTALPFVVLLLMRVFGSATMKPQQFHLVILILTYQFVIPLSALLLGVSILGDELEGRTITYVWTRPVGRGWLYLGRYLGTGVAYSLLFVTTMALALHLRTPAEQLAGVSMWRPIGIGVAAFFVYLSVFALLRTLLKRALVVGMFYTLVMEFVVAWMPRVGAGKLSIWHHVLVLHLDAYDASSAPLLRTAAGTVGADETFAAHATVLACVCVGALAIGMLMVRTREYPVAGSVA